MREIHNSLLIPSGRIYRAGVRKRVTVVLGGGLILDGRQTGVRPVKLLKMIVWRGGTRSDRASHRTLRPVKLLEMIVWHGGPIKPRIPLRVAYEVRAARQQTVRSPRTMYPHSQEWHQNREEAVYLPA